MLINSKNNTERHRGGAAPKNTTTKLRWPDTSEQHARRIKNDRRKKPAKRKRHVKSERDDASLNKTSGITRKGRVRVQVHPNQKHERAGGKRSQASGKTSQRRVGVQVHPSQTLPSGEPARRASPQEGVSQRSIAKEGATNRLAR